MINRLVAPILAATMTLSATVSAEVSDYDRCKVVSSFAEAIMSARQSGVTYSKLYEITVDSKDGTAPLARLMIKGAFETSKYSTKEYQDQKSKEFGNLFFNLCINEKADK